MLTLIDGNSLLFRAFYGMHAKLTRRDGRPVGAVFGVCNMVLPLINLARPGDRFICVFDATRKNFRNEIYPAYKANRTETPADLIAQKDLVMDAMKAMGMPVLCVPDVEADDVIATLVKNTCDEAGVTRIVTGDKDLMQLVSDCCFLYDGMKEKEIHGPEVLDKFGVPPAKVIDVQSLMGDSSDNIPGVPGIGPKKASELINEFGSLDDLFEKIDSVKNERVRNLLKENKDKALVSRQLVTLKTDVELPDISYGDFVFQRDKFVDFALGELESPSLVAKVNRMSVPLHPGPQKGAVGGLVQQESFGTDAGNESNFEIIYSEQELDNFLATVKNTLAIDTETTGLDQMRNKVVGISLAASPNYGVYIPIRHKEKITDDLFDDATTNTNRPQLSIERVKEKLWSFLINPKIVKVGHNLKYDLHILANEGWDVTKISPVDDTMLLSYALNGSRHAHNMDELAKIYLDHETIGLKSLFPPKTKSADLHFENLAIETAAPYAAEDAWVTFALYELFRERMDSDIMPLRSLPEPPPAAQRGASAPPLEGWESCLRPGAQLFGSDTPVLDSPPSRGGALAPLCAAGGGSGNEVWQSHILGGLRWLYENCDLPLMKILFSMERRGVLVNQTGLHHLSLVFHEQLRNMEKEIWDLAGHEFNIASPQQLATVLYDEMGLPQHKSTDADTLAELEHPIADKILAWRSIAKLAGTYADSLPKQIAADGRIHTTYLQTSTNTGRLSSRDPNLQNIPIKTKLGEEIRKCFVAAPGKVLISVDYSQIQLRLLADVADVKMFKDTFAMGRDIHSETARKIFDIPENEEVPKDLRARAKTVNFSIVYGISSFGLATQLGVSRTEASQLIDSYMSGLPEIHKYIEDTKKFATEHGFVMTPWGRKIFIGEINNPRMRAYALRAAINAPIQGFEADIVRHAMVKIAKAEIPAEMIMQVHDEIVFECDADKAQAVSKQIIEIMESAVNISVPLLAEANISDKWGK